MTGRRWWTAGWWLLTAAGVGLSVLQLGLAGTAFALVLLSSFATSVLLFLPAGEGGRSPSTARAWLRANATVGSRIGARAVAAVNIAYVSRLLGLVLLAIAATAAVTALRPHLSRRAVPSSNAVPSSEPRALCQRCLDELHRRAPSR
jgi:uncharacterized membrane protein YfcA